MAAVISTLRTPTLPPPLVDHENCAVGPAGSGCRLCVESCPYGAIDLRERPGTTEVRIDGDHCQRCGLCSAICPTSSIERAFDPDTDILASVLAATAEAPDLLVIGGASAPAEASAVGTQHVIGLRSPLVIDETILLTAVLSGAGRVLVVSEGPSAPGTERLEQVVASANTMSANAMSGAHRVVFAHPGEADAALVLAAISGPLGHHTSRLDADDSDRLMVAPTKRQRLGVLLGTVDGGHSPLLDAPGFGAVEVNDETCLACGSCAVSCPTDAITFEPAAGTLSARDIDCIGCSSCVSACPNGSIELLARVPDGSASLVRRTLVADEVVTCRTCHEPFAPRRLIEHSRQVIVNAGLDPSDAALQVGVCATCREAAPRNGATRRRDVEPHPTTALTNAATSHTAPAFVAAMPDGVFLGDVPPPAAVPIGMPTVGRRTFLKGAGAAMGAAVAAPFAGGEVAAADSHTITPGRMGMVIDLTTCIGCHACTAVCKAENNVPLGVYRDWVEEHVLGEYPHARPVFLPKLCNHCDSPGCLRACPTGAIFKRADGIVDLNPDICIACQACMQGCPYGMTFYNPARGTADKCNLCTHRIDEGLEPACVDVCPSKCRIVGDFDDPESPVSQYLRDRPSSVLRDELGLGPNIRYVGLPDELDR